MLEVANPTRRFGGLVANDAISVRAEAGGILGSIGPTRAGTLLRRRIERTGHA